MAKKVLTLIKLQIPGGQANPAPPVGLRSASTASTSWSLQGVQPLHHTPEHCITPVEITVFGGPLVHVHHEDPACLPS